MLAAGAAWLAASQKRDNDRLMSTLGTLTNNVTGGDSYPVVVPQGEGDFVPLVVWNYGDAPLSGVTVDISCDFPLAVQREIVGTIPAHSAYHLLTHLLPAPCRDMNQMSIDGEPVASWWITITTRNGAYTEIIEFKRGTNCEQWSYRFWVDADRGVGFDANHRLKILGSDRRLYTVGDWVGDERCARGPELPKELAPR